MVQFYKANKGRQQATKSSTLRHRELMNITIDDVDHHGNGINITHNPIIVVGNALPDEEHRVRIVEKKRRVWKAETVTILSKNEARVKPVCTHFSECGGCASQNIHPDMTLTLKQKSLNGFIERQTPYSAIRWEKAIVSASLRYRRRTRLAVDARNPSKIKLGYRQAKSNTIFTVKECPVLVKSLESLIPLLQQWMNEMGQSHHIGHIQLTEGKSTLQIVIKTVKCLSNGVIIHLRTLLSAHSQKNEIECEVIILNKAGEVTVSDNDNSQLVIEDVAGLSLALSHQSFLQVNQQVNQQMIDRALDWLAVSNDAQVFDLFCGVGNFSLAVAKLAKQVIGVEVSADMVQQANHNAQLNGIYNSRFIQADLAVENPLSNVEISLDSYVLLDPSREGAENVIKNLIECKPKKILYVSCNPVTLTRDINLLAHDYSLSKTCLLDMFPMTKHVEVMVLFERKARSRR